MKVIGKRIFVRRAERKGTTDSGIVLPGKAAEQRDTGTVVGVGTRVESQVAEGDRIIFIDHSAVEVHVGDEKLLSVMEDDVLAVVE